MFVTDKLQSIDLTGNQISGMDEDVFRSLPQLKELLLADNNLQVMPELPVTMKHIDLRNNRLISRGVHSEGFKVNILHICLKYKLVLHIKIGLFVLCHSALENGSVHDLWSWRSFVRFEKITNDLTKTS